MASLSCSLCSQPILLTLCICHVRIVGHTGRYSTGQCHMSGTTNAEINNDGCRQIQEPVRHVRVCLRHPRWVSKDRSSLGHHGRTKCASIRFVCTQSQCTLANRRGLTEHVEIVHEKLVKFQCEHCEKGYSHRSHYLDHLAIHTGIKRNVCPVCQRQFTFKCNLKTRMLRVHNFIPSETDPVI